MLEIGSGELEAFKAFADSLDELMFVWKPNGDVLWMSQAFMRELGKTANDLGLQSPERPMLCPDDLEHVLGELGPFLDSEAVHSRSIESRFIDTASRTHPVTSIVHKVNWLGEPALLVVANLIGATNGSADRGYRRLLESAADGILKLAADGHIVYSNRRFQEMCRQSSAELARLRLPDLVLADERAPTERALERLRSGEPCLTFDARLRRDGDEDTLEVRVCRVDDPSEDAVFLAIARDVSQVREQENRLRKGQKLESLSTLAGGVAHDFNNIVTTVLANATLAETMLSNASASIVEVVRDIRVAAERAADLNTSLLAYVGQAPTTFEVVDLHECARKTVRTLSGLIDHDARIELAAAGEPPLVQADPSQVSQVMSNMITNGAEAGPKGGVRVTVETGVAHHPGAVARAWLPAAPAPGRYAFVRVTDDGEGMTADVVERIFDPFFSTKATGRGLGLSASLGIVRRHAGALSIDSEPGRGTCVEIVLPLAEGPEAKARRSQPLAAPVSTGVVLFCDDEQLILQLGKRILEREGYEVVLASTGEGALDKLEANRDRFSVLVVDHSLPGLRGDKVAQRARELRPDLAVVMASGYRDVAEKTEISGSVFLPKPYTRAALVDSVRAAMRAAPARKDIARGDAETASHRQ